MRRNDNPEGRGRRSSTRNISRPEPRPQCRRCCRRPLSTTPAGLRIGLPERWRPEHSICDTDLAVNRPGADARHPHQAPARPTGAGREAPPPSFKAAAAATAGPRGAARLGPALPRAAGALRTAPSQGRPPGDDGRGGRRCQHPPSASRDGPRGDGARYEGGPKGPAAETEHGCRNYWPAN